MRKEQGSITMIVFATVIFILIILGTTLTAMTYKRKSQAIELQELKDIYDMDSEEIARIAEGGNAGSVVDESKYGREVDYNGNTYQLFYVDTDGKYSGGVAGVWLQLKETSGSIKLSLTSTTSTLGIITDSEDSVFWEVNPSLNNQFKTQIRRFTESTLNWNLRGVGYLCDKTKWTDTYVESGDKTKGAFAIGGVSAEMFCDSYNQYKGRTSTDAGYFEAKAFSKTATGYFYKPKNSGATGTSASGDYGSYTDMSNYEIQASDASNMYRYTTYTYLASPSAKDKEYVCCVRSFGDLNCGSIYDMCSVRPAVFLPSSIKIQLKD